MTQHPLQHRRRRRSALLDLLKTAAQALLIFVILSALVGRFEIHQVSMEPTFHEGQRVLVSKLGSLWSSFFIGTAHAAEGRQDTPFALKRGQIIVFYKSPSRDEDALIKRVVGLPGDTIELRAGTVLVNGAVLDEPYLNDAATECSNICGPLLLGPDQYFVLGDNRSNSLDSRVFGPIPASQIVGRVVARYWPPERIAVYP